MNTNRGLLLALFLVGAFFLCVCAVLAGAAAIRLQNQRGVLGLPSSAPSTVMPSPSPTRETARTRPTPPSSPPSQTPQQPLPNDLEIARALSRVVNRVAKQVSPSVVNITVDVGSDILGGTGQGSGFVIDKEGHIVTNNHVVEEARSITVRFQDSTEVKAEVVGTDPDSDLAVIRVDVDPEVLKPVELGDSDALKVGDWVIAIGNPFGFEGSVTFGIVSATGRAVRGVTGRGFSLPNLIQTDAAINPGNSGGPLVDIEGRVVGVNTLIFSQTPMANSGVGFAIPVNTVKRVVPALIEEGSFQHPFIGISGLEVTPTLAEQLDLPVDHGVLVVEVFEDSGADKAGLRAGTREVTLPDGEVVPADGDVIIAIDGREVRTFEDLVNYLDTRSVGDTITLTIVRDGQTMDVEVTLGPRPTELP